MVRAPESDDSSVAYTERACINHSPRKTFAIEAKGRVLTSNIPPIRFACFSVRRRLTRGLSLWPRLGSSRGLCTCRSRSLRAFIYHRLPLLPLRFHSNSNVGAESFNRNRPGGSRKGRSISGRSRALIHRVNLRGAGGNGGDMQMFFGTLSAPVAIPAAPPGDYSAIRRHRSWIQETVALKQELAPQPMRRSPESAGATADPNARRETSPAPCSIPLCTRESAGRATLC